MDGEKLERRKRDFWENRKRGTGERVWRCRASHSTVKLYEYYFI